MKSRLRDANVPFPVLLEPIDYLARVINGKDELPPLRLRKASGPLSSFETSSVSFIAFLSAAVGIHPTQRILDIGCGCGAIALQLRGFFRDGGGYTGVDIHAPSVSWCQSHLTKSDSRLEFSRIDVRNAQYNPDGAEDAGTFVFPFADKTFDIILLKSVFTHMRPEQVENYLKEISRLLRDGGHCLMSFFLLTAERRKLVEQGQSPTFSYGRGAWRYSDQRMPERAIAYEEEHIMGLLNRYGLVLERPILYAHQDILLATPSSTLR
jgi:SAM-dependent methyltransferase